MDINFYNTLTRKKELFKPLNNSGVNTYTCGPTVYNYAHIGNLRSYIFADILYRTLKFNGYKVKWVMNITNVDDKTIKGTVRESGEKAGVAELIEYSDKYFQAFLEDLQKLNILENEIKFIKVSEVIPQIQKFIVKLIDKGYAYKAEDGSTYFNINKYQEDFGRYGELVGEKFLEGKKIGARVKVDEYEKDNLSDFALWKARDQNDADIYWDHPLLGAGRPGWHIECSVINNVAFGNQTVDIHTGGIDLIFPHHTNEIAQSEALLNNQFVKYWLHSDHILVDGQKMAKSLNNFYCLKDLIEKSFDPIAYRYLLLQANYKQQINFTWEALKAAQTSYEELLIKLAQLAEQTKNKTGQIMEKWQTDFAQAINDNLNTSLALATIWKLLDSDGQPADKLVTALRFDEVLGLNFGKIFELIKIPEKIKKMAAEREEARLAKNWKDADRIRQQINERGFTIQDTDLGPFIYKKLS